MDNTGAQADRARNRVREAEDLISTARDELDKAKEAISKVVNTNHILIIQLNKYVLTISLNSVWLTTGHQNTLNVWRSKQHDSSGRGSP